MPSEIDTACAIVEEYYEAMSVVARDTREAFAQLYFAEGAGVWLAWVEEKGHRMHRASRDAAIF